jgi:signal transduction histidine kinase
VIGGKSMKDAWPFIPDHISNDCSEFGLKGVGIMRRDELQGTQTVMSAILKNPNAVYEAYGENLLLTGSILAECIDSCERLRQCTNTELCSEFDQRIAKIFLGLKRSDAVQLDDEISRVIPKLSYKLTEERKPVTLSMYEKRPYLEYDCQYLGYRELLFPVFFPFSPTSIGDRDYKVCDEDKIIAVFFVGQILLEKNRYIVKKIQNSFFKNFFTSNFGARFPNVRIIDKKIIRSRNEILWNGKKENVRVRTDEEYQEMIRETHKVLSNFECQLSQKVRHQQEHFALRVVDDCNRSLHDGLGILKDISLQNEKPLKELWIRITEQLTELCNRFSFKYIALFSVDEAFSSYDNRLPLVSIGSSSMEIIPSNMIFESFLFRTSDIPQDADWNQYSSYEYSGLLRGLPENWPFSKTGNSVLVLTHPMPFHMNTPIVIVIGHDQLIGPTEYQYINNALRTFFTGVVSVLSSLLERLIELKTTNSFRVLRHETEPQTYGLKSLVHNYLKDERMRDLTVKKANDICQDIDEYLDRINYLFANARNLLTIMIEKKELALQREVINIIGDMFYKIKDLFRTYLADRGMAMPLPKARDKSIWPPIYADRRLVDLMLFNLINNALKYGHRGTNIQLEYIFVNDVYHFNIVNYGPGISADENNNDIFRLFVRKRDTQGEEGAGIGLAVATAVATAHGGKLNFEQAEVSQLNVPFIRPLIDYLERNIFNEYQQRQIQRFELKLLKEWNKEMNFNNFVFILKDEHRRLICDREMRDVTSKLFLDDLVYKKYLNECLDNILIPTYKITFKVTIPKYIGERSSKGESR